MRVPKVILVLILLANSLSAVAQFGSGDPVAINKLMSRVLVVITEVPDKQWIDSLEQKNPQAATMVKSQYDNFNRVFKESIDKNWALNKQVKRFTWDEFYALDATTKQLFTVMFLVRKQQTVKKGLYISDGAPVLVADKWNVVAGKPFEQFYHQLVVDFGENASRKPSSSIIETAPAFVISLPEQIPNRTSLFFAVKFANRYLLDKVSGMVGAFKFQEKLDENRMRLPGKTILIRKDWADETFTMKKVKQLYHYPVEICIEQILESMIQTNNVRYAFVVRIPNSVSSVFGSKLEYIQMIIDNEDGAILGISQPEGFGYAGEDKVRERSFKEMVKGMRY